MLVTNRTEHYHLFLFICLLRSNKTVAFLQWFPHFNSVFTHCKEKYDWFVQMFHAYYVQKFVHKTGFPSRYDWYLKEIHRLHYIPSVRMRNKKPITMTTVRQYLSTVSPLQVVKLMCEPRFII